MVLRWIHKSWKYFWTVIITVLLLVLILAGGLVGMLQLKVTKSYLTKRIEDDFSNNYRGQLTVGELNGLLPFNLQLDDVHLLTAGTADSSHKDTVLSLDRLNASLDIWSLLKNKISIIGFSVDQPRAKFLAASDAERRYTLSKALERIKTKTEKPGQEDEIWISKIEIVAPRVVINEGNIYVEKFFGQNNALNLPEPFLANNINARMFLELSEAQRFWDIEELTAQLPGLKAGNFAINGQIYNDAQFLELNAFNISAGNSKVKLSGEVDGVDLYKRNLSSQFWEARYNVRVSSDRFELAEFTDIVPDLPVISEPLEFSVKSEGIIDSLWVDEFSLGVGDSYFSINGLFKNISDRRRLQYRFKMAEVALKKKDVEVFTGPLDEKQFNVLENLRFNGKANGTQDSVNVDLDLSSPYGEVSLIGGTQLRKPYRYNGSLTGKTVNLGPVVEAGVDTTNLNFDAVVNGMGITQESAVLEFSASAYNSSINDIGLDELELKSSLLSGFWEQEYTYRNGEQLISGTGWIDLSKEDFPLALKGNAQNINLASYIPNKKVPSSKLNLDYNIKMQGLSVDRLQGRANLDIKNSLVNGDSIRSHQFYMDLDSPDQNTRSFRLTSSLFDLSMTGKIVPTNIASHVKYWSGYLTERFRKEILLEDNGEMKASVDPYVRAQPLVLEGDFEAKDLSLIKKYWADFPDVFTDTRLKFTANADSSRLLVSADIRADTLAYNELHLKDSQTQLTASFRSDKKLKEYASLEFKTDVSHLETNLVTMDSVDLRLDLKKDSLEFTQKVGRFSENARMNLVIHSTLSDTALNISVSDFFLGNNTYAWQAVENPEFIYSKGKKVKFQNFRLENRNEFLELQGTLSPDRKDSLRYTVRDVSLKRISELIKGKIDFRGKLNGSLITRSLTKSPSVQGEMNVTKLTLDNRLIGDATFKSRYNSSKERFDTQIRVFTDSTKYARYLASNDGIGQNFLIDGYFVPPDPEAAQDTVYHFDVDFNEIDMWIIPLIAPNVFDRMEGKATGKGYFTGNLEDYDFSADFQTSNVFAKPRFLNTNYFLDGPVTFNREDGVVIDSVKVTDTKGGTGLLWGSVDLNDFEPISFIDLSFKLNDLQLINNRYDPDIPFYGSISGTGLLKLSGANTDLLLQTANPIRVSEASRLSIPLIEETELNENTKFIQFVDKFDVSKKKKLSLTEESLRKTSADRNELEKAIEALTFNERFNLDLQFNAPRNVNVDLIFDPVTGEILKAKGNGQLRITMQNEEVQMFGRYQTTGGSYQFVSGEIFTRKLDLEPGGTILWEGPPDNARLDISAVYHARPDISTLDYQSKSVNESGSQRAPVDLIVEIKGTVNSVENNYYFRLPNSLDLSSNSTLSFTINQINQDEQQKLLQATSILLTGNFIPTESYNQGTSSLGQSLTRGSTVLNPLLSNQVISPLLSSQINALLNSDVTRFDVDFNLNAYNEVDLGIALRLYNDKLIFRREGQVGGRSDQSLGERIGDLNATYRINRGLSITAFHRQDQTLGNVTASSQAGDVSPTVDGIGLEAQVQFNTWQGLSDRVKKTFRSIFGIEQEEEEKLASDKDKTDKNDDKNDRRDKEQENRNRKRKDQN